MSELLNDGNGFVAIFGIMVVSIAILLPFRIYSKNIRAVLFSVGVAMSIFLLISLLMVSMNIFQDIPKTSIQWGDTWNSILRIGILSVMVGTFVGVLVPFFQKK